MKFIFVAPVVATGLLLAGGSASKAVSNVRPVYNDGSLLSVKAGTLGVGIDITKKISKNVALRANINGLKYTGTKKIYSVKYNYDLTLATAGAILDYFPKGSGFRISGGVYYNGNKITGTKNVGVATVTVGGKTYSASTGLKRIDAKIDFNKIDPYIGIGWSSFNSENGWSIDIDLGAMYSGSPKVQLTPTFTSSANKAFKSNVNSSIKKEESKIAFKYKNYKITPVIMIGVTHRF